MLRSGFAYVLSALVALTGLILADARGTAPVPTTQVVICSGTTLTTISIGPGGQPVERSTPCPDGAAIFAATFSLPGIAAPEPRLLAVIETPRAPRATPQPTPSPSARGPPVPV